MALVYNLKNMRKQICYAELEWRGKSFMRIYFEIRRIDTKG